MPQNKSRNILKFNRHTYKDLSIGNEIFKGIDNTITKFGKKKLKNRLHYVSTDIIELQRITDLVNSISQDFDYVEKNSSLLNQIKLVENDIHHWMLEKPDESLLFGYNFLNNRLFLTISNKMKFSSVFIMIVMYILIYVLLLYWGIPISLYDYGKSIISGYKMFMQIILYYFFEDDDFIEYGALLLVLLYVSYQMYMFYQSVNTCIEHYGKCNTFYDNYESINKFVITSQKIHYNNKYFKDDNVKSSIEYLQYYFDNSSTLGFSLVSKLAIDDYVKHVDTISNYVGRIDMWIGISKLILKGYSIPNFVLEDKPSIKADGVFNPIIKENKRIPNDVDINNTNLTIITGPNKAGKSTYMRSIMVSVYLAQSIGITCADYLELTPFYEMYTYINVPDCVGRESLFEAEINRCFDYLKRVENCQSKRFYTLGLVDELFTGTNPKEGMAGSYAVINKLKKIDTNITILSTHFHDICDPKDKKIKYQMFIAVKEYHNNNPFQYTYKFPYTVRSGISDQCIALELLKEKGFNNEIVNSAFGFLKKAEQEKYIVKNVVQQKQQKQQKQ